MSLVYIYIYIYIYIYFISGLLVKGKWPNLRDTFRREYAKISNKTTGTECPDVSAQRAGKHYKRLLFLVDMFSSRRLKTSVPLVPSQTSEPADDNNQEYEYGMADDSITDLDLEVSNTSGDTQEAEVVSAAQKDPPAGQSMKLLKETNTYLLHAAESFMRS